MLTPVLDDAVESLTGNAGVIALWKEDLKKFVETVTYGLDSDGVKRVSALLKTVIPDLASRKNSYDRLSHLIPAQHFSMLEVRWMFDPVIAMPFWAGNNVRGVICVLRSPASNPFNSVDQRVLSAFVSQTVMLIDNDLLTSQLAEERYKVESIVEHSADGIMTIDSERRILSFNTSMERLTGWSRSEAIGNYCFHVLKLTDRHGDDLCQGKCPVVTGVSGLYSQRGAIVARDSKKIDVDMGYSLLSGSGGFPSTVVVNVRDISALRQIEDMRSLLLAGVSHELQTPISIIKAYASTLARTDVEWSPQILREKLNAIEEESDRLSELVTKLLYTSQLETGSIPLNRMLVHLPKEAGKVAKRLAGETEIHKLEVDFPPDFPGIYADPEKITEVLNNLVDNAIKFSPSGGTVTIRGEVLEEEVRVTVADEGIGISLRDQARLFERFSRVGDVRARSVPGMGLGLYICKTIIETHEGRICAEGVPGKGSKFIFTLPISASG